MLLPVATTLGNHAYGLQICPVIWSFLLHTPAKDSKVSLRMSTVAQGDRKQPVSACGWDYVISVLYKEALAPIFIVASGNHWTIHLSSTFSFLGTVGARQYAWTSPASVGMPAGFGSSSRGLQQHAQGGMFLSVLLASARQEARGRCNALEETKSFLLTADTTRQRRVTEGGRLLLTLQYLPEMQKQVLVDTGIRQKPHGGLALGVIKGATLPALCRVLLLLIILC